MGIMLDEYTQANMEKIKDLIGKEYPNPNKFDKIVWVLHSCNDLGVPYFHKRGQKRLYTVLQYTHIDLLLQDAAIKAK